MTRWIRIFVPDGAWFLGAQWYRSGWSTRGLKIDFAIVPPFVVSVDFGLIRHRLFEQCEFCASIRSGRFAAKDVEAMHRAP